MDLEQPYEAVVNRAISDGNIVLPAFLRITYRITRF
jgi:hypothetical protein